MNGAPLTILLHSSKTMKHGQVSTGVPLTEPLFLAQAKQLQATLKTLAVAEIAKAMHVSDALAQRVSDQIAAWDTAETGPALLSFTGDIFSGLRADEFSPDDVAYAQRQLRFLSGLYGILRPLDAVAPYRLEMGYTLPGIGNMVKFWGEQLAQTVPSDGVVVNVSSAEYTKALLPYLPSAHVVTPYFLTRNAKTGLPTFTAVHAKIARGAYARWLIQTRATANFDPQQFTDLGYRYDAEKSTALQPVYICEQFGGLGLSRRKK